MQWTLDLGLSRAPHPTRRRNARTISVDLMLPPVCGGADMAVLLGLSAAARSPAI